MKRILTTALISLATCSSWAEDQIWFEAEKPLETNMLDDANFASKNLKRRDLLSGGAWLTAQGKRYGPAVWATYSVEATTGGEYQFWVRKFYTHGPFKWSFSNDGPSGECGKKVGLADSVEMQKYICANWINLGTIKLASGKHTLRIESADTELKKAVPVVPPIDKKLSVTKSDWCEVTTPATVYAGQTIPIVVKYSGITEKTRLNCGVVYLKSSTKFGGVLGNDKEAPEIQGDGTFTFNYYVKNKTSSMVNIVANIYLSKDRSWKKKTKTTATKPMPVDADSVASRPSNGASGVGLDCFLLTQRPFQPNGKYKPGEKTGLTEDGWFPFEPGLDPNTDDVLLDLRKTNHKVCGEKGVLTRKGMDFYWEKDSQNPVKFWGGCFGSEIIRQSKLTHEIYARRLSKLGVNMVRLHGNLWKCAEGDEYFEVTDKYLDDFNHFVACLRKNGVYLMLNTWYDLWIRSSKAKLPGYRGNKTPSQFQFIHPQGHAIWKKTVERLLNSKNPYTGLRNGDDPTISMVQIVNEDNYFFHTFSPYDHIPKETMNILEKRFGDWLIQKRGSIEKAFESWGKTKSVKGDDLKEGRVGMVRASGLNPKRKRHHDQAQFMVEDMRSVLTDFQDYLRKDLGYKGSVNAGNWLNANRKRLEPLDKYSNAVCDVIDRHGVGFNPHCKLELFYKVQKGDLLANRTGLTEPQNVPIMEIMYENTTSIVSEPKSTMPNRFRTEWMPLLTCYGLLQGLDGQMHFKAGPFWQGLHRRWSLETPVSMGQAPALTLIYKNRYIKQGPVVVREALKLKDLYELKGSAFSGAVGMDEMTIADVNLDSDKEVATGDINPLSFYCGQVVRAIGNDPGKSTRMDLSKYIDTKNKTVTSVTGELKWDYNVGLVTVNAPCAQGAFGFFKKAGEINTDIVKMNIDNEYASVFVVSMDGKPLKESSKILLQVVTEDKNYGWKTKPVKKIAFGRKGKGPVLDGEKIISLGGAPIIVKEIEGSVSINRSDASKFTVKALDFNGYLQKEMPKGNGDKITVKLLPNSLYYIISK